MTKTLETQFPKLSELLHGIPTEKTLAFIDLWGTTSQVDKYMKSGDILDIGNLTQIQGRFSSVLASIAQNNPTFDVIQASDGAFIIADDAHALLDQIQMMFAYLSMCSGRFQFIPLRAALSKGVHGIHKHTNNLQGLTNFQFLPYLGPAFVKVYKMEKSWPKGMRIFFTESVLNSLPSKHSLTIGTEHVGEVNIIQHGSEKYYELNWLNQTTYNGPLVQVKIGEDFLTRARLWADKGDKYQKDMGESIIEYGAWALIGHYLKPELKWHQKLEIFLDLCWHKTKKGIRFVCNRIPFLN